MLSASPAGRVDAGVVERDRSFEQRTSHRRRWCRRRSTFGAPIALLPREGLRKAISALSSSVAALRRRTPPRLRVGDEGFAAVVAHGVLVVEGGLRGSPSVSAAAGDSDVALCPNGGRQTALQTGCHRGGGGEGAARRPPPLMAAPARPGPPSGKSSGVSPFFERLGRLVGSFAYRAIDVNPVDVFSRDPWCSFERVCSSLTEPPRRRIRGSSGLPEIR